MEVTNPLVSILVPVYNTSKYLSKCINSILDQSYRNLQIILLDDGSSDNSLTICNQFAIIDHRVEVYSQCNQGVAITRNNLLCKVRGEYVLFVDSDDWIELNMIEYLLGLIQMYKADIVLCEKLLNDQAPVENIAPENLLTNIDAIHDFLQHEYFVGSLWNKLLKRSIIGKEQFQSGISYGEDALFIWRLLRKADKIVTSKKQLYHYRINPTSLCHNYNGHQFSSRIVWEQIVDETSELYPNFTNLAKAQYCNQMTIILYDAARNGYKYDDKVAMLAKIVSLNKWSLRCYDKSCKKYLFACAISRFYKIIQRIFEIIKR